ncbi:hypothetical protein [Rhodococcus sovatensis]|uniref:Shikimate kinase n=1 Tax=Rhodococcus sovatensis TaxID=1805840 RepID=A0ABZ2PIH3_9NOCA
MNVIAGASFAYAAGRFTMVLDGIVGPWMLQHFRYHAPDIDVHYVVLRPDRDITLARAQARTVPHALVDEQPIITMWHQFASMGSYESHVLDTSTDDAHRSIERAAGVVASNMFRLNG